LIAKAIINNALLARSLLKKIVFTMLKTERICKRSIGARNPMRRPEIIGRVNEGINSRN
jgi:hypothetical protein